MADVVVLGDANVDIIAHFSAFPDKGGDALASASEMHCGGSAANTARTLSCLGIPTSLIARLGPDSWALKVLDCLGEAGVSLAALQRDPAVMTGLMYIVVTPDGDRTMLGYRGANVLTEPGEIDEAEIRAARLFHLSGYALLSEPQRSAALHALAIACHQGLTISLDPGLALSRDVVDHVRALLPTVNILLPNLAEAQRLAGCSAPEECAQALVEAGVGVAAVKLGRQGSLVATAGGVWRVPGFDVQTRDSTGAGDSFDAGLIAGSMAGLAWDVAALLGNALGAIAAARVGAGAPGPGARDVLRLLGDHQAVDQGTIDRVAGLVAARAAAPEQEGEPW
jgi:ribokinase